MFHHPMWDFLLPRNGRRCHLRNVGTLFVYKHTVLRVKRNWYLEFYGFSLILYKIWKFYDLKQKKSKKAQCTWADFGPCQSRGWKCSPTVGWNWP